MIESGYYPIGEEYNPNAPYNQSNIEPIQLNVIISQSLSRPTTIEVTDYTTNEWEDIEYDEDGHMNRTKGIEYDFSDSNLKRSYEEQEYTIPELLREFGWILEIKIIEIEAAIKFNDNMSIDKKALESNISHYNKLLESIEGWIVDELEVIKE